MWRLFWKVTLAIILPIFTLNPVSNSDYQPFDDSDRFKSELLDGFDREHQKGPSPRRPSLDKEIPDPPPAGVDNLQTIYMEDHCRLHIRKYVLDNARVYVDDAVHVELAKDSTTQQQFACLVTFSTRDPDWRLMLHFEQVDINYNPGTIDRFRIYDGIDAHTELTPALGLYGKYSKGSYEFSSGNIHDYVSSGQALTLYFIGSPSDSFQGFKVLLTVFKAPSISGECDVGYLKCVLNGYCISEAMLCNGAQNCGENDLSDSHSCYDKDDDKHTNIFHGSADLGLMIGCALSIIILMVVVIWLGIICMKKKGFASMRQYIRQDTSGDSSFTPDGTIVEPAEIHRVDSPSVNFMEPPPPYSENDVAPCEHQISEGHIPRRFELPPPYSPLDERDTAGLILNESSTNGFLPRGLLRSQGYRQTPDYNAQGYNMPAVHDTGRNSNHPPVPPVRTSSNTSHCGHFLRLRRNSGPSSSFRPLTGVTRQSIQEEEVIPHPASVQSDNQINSIIENNSANVLWLEANTELHPQETTRDNQPSLDHSPHKDTISEQDDQDK